MTRKDYEAIAKVIAAAEPVETMPADWRRGCDSAREYIANQLATVLKVDNPRFDRDRFLKACGL